MLFVCLCVGRLSKASGYIMRCLCVCVGVGCLKPLGISFIDCVSVCGSVV